MDELVDIVDINGKATGKTCMKSEAHKKGYWHSCAHVWVYNGNKEILIQKRIETKDTFPGMWDVSVAGHIGAGEDPKIAAVREVSEEVGFETSISDLEYIGHYSGDVKHSDTLIDREYHHVYIVEYKGAFTDLKIQEEEVAEIKFVSLDQYRNGMGSNAFVPYPKNYIDMVFEAIKNKLG